jgi:hypothetical protein
MGVHGLSHVEEVGTEIGYFKLVVAIIKSVLGDDIHCKCAIPVVQINRLGLRDRFLDTADEFFCFGLHSILQFQYSFARKNEVDNCATNTMQFVAGSCESGCLYAKGVIEVSSLGRSF